MILHILLFRLLLPGPTSQGMYITRSAWQGVVAKTALAALYYLVCVTGQAGEKTSDQRYLTWK